MDRLTLIIVPVSRSMLISILSRGPDFGNQKLIGAKVRVKGQVLHRPPKDSRKMVLSINFEDQEIVQNLDYRQMGRRLLLLFYINTIQKSPNSPQKRDNHILFIFNFINIKC